MSATCRSCGAPIIWAITASGKRMPLDAEPVLEQAGLFRLERNDDQPAAPLAVAHESPPLYVSHFATCPHADQHRRSRT